MLLTCPVCGKAFRTFPSWTRNHETYTCSRACRGKMQSKLTRKPRPLCIACGKERVKTLGHSFCGAKCRWEAQSGSANSCWRGGRFTNKQGYVMAYARNHPFPRPGRRYLPEHIMVMELYLGRPLKPGEVVWHVNGIRDDNSILNLQVGPRRFGNQYEPRKSEGLSGRPPSRSACHRSLGGQDMVRAARSKSLTKEEDNGSILSKALQTIGEV